MTQAAYRAAAVDFLSAYASSANVKLQVYPGRPRTIYPPTGFIDSIAESFTPLAGLFDQGTPRVDVMVLHALFDAKDAVDQRDRFVDGLLGWVRTLPHAAGANSLIRISDTADLPDYVPEWLPPEQQRTYFGTRITLEGFRTD